MKLFAITPHECTAERLISALPEVSSRGASHLYIRSAQRQDIPELIDAAGKAGIMPVVPYIDYRHDMGGTCGVHFKSHELSLLAQHAPGGAALITASSHCGVDARLALQAGAGFVYVSPVFAPLSKPDDSRQLLSRSELSGLVDAHGEKIVLLGGITRQRIHDLRQEIPGDFSAAGIWMFFSPAADCFTERACDERP